MHPLIDTIRANCDHLTGYKKDLALFALGRTCIDSKNGFGHFVATKHYGQRADTPAEFRARLRRNLQYANSLVFDNGRANQAFRRDINDLLPGVETELAYFDPPYATQFSTLNYEHRYHFLEGLMCYWEGLRINPDSKVRAYTMDPPRITKANAGDFFRRLLGNAQHIPHWLLSCRDHAYPSIDEMEAIVGSFGRRCRREAKEHRYCISAKQSSASRAQEYLFVCAPL